MGVVENNITDEAQDAADDTAPEEADTPNTPAAADTLDVLSAVEK